MAAGAEEGSQATEDPGGSSCQTAQGTAAEPTTAEPTTAEHEAEPTAAVEELAAVCSSGPSTQAAAENAPAAVALLVAMGSAPSGAVSSAATAEEAQGSSRQAARTLNAAPRTSSPGAAQVIAAQESSAGGSKNIAISTRAAGRQTAREPAADHGTAPAPAGSSEGTGTSFGKGPPTSPAQETRVLLPNGRSPVKSVLGGISREGSKAASMIAEPAAQQQQPSAAVAKEFNSKMGQGESSKSAARSVANTEAVLPGQRPSSSKIKGKAGKGKRKPGKRRKGASSPAREPTATPLEAVVAGVAAAKDAAHLPVAAADEAGVGHLPAQQNPAGYASEPCLPDAQVARLEPATICGNSRTNQAASCPAANADHSSGEQQPATLMDPTCKEAKSSRATVNAAPPGQVTSKSGVAVGPAVQCNSQPAGMPDAATLKLPRRARRVPRVRTTPQPGQAARQGWAHRPRAPPRQSPKWSGASPPAAACLHPRPP